MIEKINFFLCFFHKKNLFVTGTAHAYKMVITKDLQINFKTFFDIKNPKYIFRITIKYPKIYYTINQRRDYDRKN